MCAKSLTLVSEMDGILVDGSDRPVPGVTVTRTWDWAWGGQTGQDRAETDAQGRFAFAAVTVRAGLRSRFPHAPSIAIRYIAELDDGPLRLLSINKLNYDPDGELEGRRLTVRCRSDIEPSADTFFFGTCNYIGPSE